MAGVTSQPAVSASASTAARSGGGGRRVYVVRHGERCDHVAPSWRDTAQLPHDPPLSPLGMAQAWDAAGYFASLPPESARRIRHVFVSPYIRTLQTAYPIACALGLPLRPEPGFAEWHEEAPLRAPPKHHKHTHNPPGAGAAATAGAGAAAGPAVLMAQPYIRDAAPHICARFALSPDRAFVPHDAPATGSLAATAATVTAAASGDAKGSSSSSNNNNNSSSIVDASYVPVVAMHTVVWHETEHDMVQRVQATLLRVLQRTEGDAPDGGGDIVVVTHASPMQALTHVVHRPNQPPRVTASRMPSYANVSVLHVDDAALAAADDAAAAGTGASAPVTPAGDAKFASATAASAVSTAGAKQVVDSAGLSSVVEGLRFTLAVEADSAHVRCQMSKCVAATTGVATATATASGVAVACATCAARDVVYRARPGPCVPYSADALARTAAFVLHTSGAEEQAPPAPAALHGAAH